MPDDPNLFDDDNLWSAGLPGSGDAGDGARPPWQTYPGEPSAAGVRPAESSPWQQHPASSTPGSSTPMQSPPWQAHPGETPAPPPGSQAAGPSWDEIGWSDQSDAGRTTSPAGSDELPHGLTGALPWRSAAQPAESGLTASADDSGWLETFGQTGYDARSAVPQDDGDLSWLTGDTGPTEPAAPAGSDETLWPDDDLFADLDAAAPLVESVPPVDSAPIGLVRRLSQPESAAPEPALSESDLTIDDLFDSAFGDAFEDIIGEAGLADEQPPDGDLPPAVAGDLPDWLRGEAAPPSVPLADAWGVGASGDVPAEEETLPAWAEDADSFAAQSEASASGLSYDEWEQAEIEREQEAAKTDEDRLLEEVPAWFNQADQPAAPAPADEQAAGPEFVPDWFTGLDAQDLEAAPDWFQKLDYTADPLAAPPSEPETPSPAISDAVMPDWLRPDGLLDLAGPDEQLPGSEQQPPSEEWVVDEPLPDEIDFLDRLGGAAASGTVSGWGGQPPTPPQVPVPEYGQELPPVEDFVERFDPFAPGEPEPLEPEPAGFDLGSDTLDWLQDLSAEDLTESAPEAPVEAYVAPPEPEPEAVEDWLSGEAMADSQAIDSLLGISDSSMALALPQEQAVAMPEEADSFEWPEDDPWLSLEQAEVSASEQPVAAGDEFPVEQAEEDYFAIDLSSAPEPPVAPVIQQAPLPPAVEESASPSQVARPQWLQEMRPADLPVTLAAGGARLDMVQRNLDDLPDTLRGLHERLSDEQAFADATRSIQPTTTSGPLADITNALPVIPAALPSIRRETTIEGLVISPDEQRRVEQLQAVLDLLAAEEDEAEEAPNEGFGFSTPSPFEFGGEEVDEASVAVAEVVTKPRPRRSHRYKADRLVIMLALLAALIVPFITDVAHFAADPPALSGDQAAVASAVDALEPGDIVLVALEYGPTAAGELDALAQAVLRDIVAQRAVPVMISTNPAAALHAEAVIAPLREDARLLKARGNAEPTLVAGEDYLLLAYLPGEAVGVRSLAQTPSNEGSVHPAFDTDLRGEDTALEVHDVAAEVALIVVVGEDSTAVRTWAEQLESIDVPKVALVTAAAESLTEPYINDQGYLGYLAGVRDTYSYNAARNSTTREAYAVPEEITFDVPNPETSRWHSMALGAAAAAAVIALGTVVNMIRALGRRRSR